MTIKRTYPKAERRDIVFGRIEINLDRTQIVLGTCGVFSFTIGGMATAAGILLGEPIPYILLTVFMTAFGIYCTLTANRIDNTFWEFLPFSYSPDDEEKVQVALTKAMEELLSSEAGDQ